MHGLIRKFRAVICANPALLYRRAELNSLLSIRWDVVFNLSGQGLNIFNITGFHLPI